MKNSLKVTPIVKIRSTVSYLIPITRKLKLDIPKLQEPTFYSISTYDVPLMDIHSERHSQR